MHRQNHRSKQITGPRSKNMPAENTPFLIHQQLHQAIGRAINNSTLNILKKHTSDPVLCIILLHLFFRFPHVSKSGICIGHPGYDVVIKRLRNLSKRILRGQLSLFISNMCEL